jgi:hypothetical protein
MIHESLKAVRGSTAFSDPPRGVDPARLLAGSREWCDPRRAK